MPRLSAWSLFWPCIVQSVKIIFNLIVHYKVPLLSCLHSLERESTGQFCVPHISQVFCPGQVNRPAPWLRNACEEEQWASSLQPLLLWATFWECAPVSVCAYVHTSHFTDAVSQRWCSKDAAAESFGEISLTYMRPPCQSVWRSKDGAGVQVASCRSSCCTDLLLNTVLSGGSAEQSETWASHIQYTAKWYMRLSSKSKDKKKHLLGHRCNKGMFALIN